MKATAELAGEEDGGQGSVKRFENHPWYGADHQDEREHLHLHQQEQCMYHRHQIDIEFSKC